MGTPDPRNDIEVLSTCSTNYEGRETIERAHLKIHLNIFPDQHCRLPRQRLGKYTYQISAAHAVGCSP